MGQIDRLNGLVGSVAIKAPCRAATTAAITLSGEQTIDGVALVTGDAVLVKDQGSGVDNGIYVVDTGTWNRRQDFDGSNDVVEGTMVKVNAGTVGQGFWYVTTTGSPIPGTDAIAFAQASSVLAVISAYSQSLLTQISQAAWITALTTGAAAAWRTALSLGAVALLDKVTAAVMGDDAIYVGAQGRLTLTSATPVTSGDVTGATTVYFTPYKGNKVELYDGTGWTLRTFTELSQATTDTTKSPAAVANDSCYDLFVWDDAGTLRCTRGPAWSSLTARGTGAGTTELEVLEGREVNKVAITNGPAAQRGLYVGTIRSDGSAQINDSATKRYVWNRYNYTRRFCRVTEPTNSWTYSSGTYRLANNNPANQVSYVCGLLEIPVKAEISHTFIGHDGTFRNAYAGIGIDSSTVNSAIVGLHAANSAGQQSIIGRYVGFPGLGSHDLRWLEACDNTGTWTWISNGSGNFLNGITAEIWA